ncbi:hypothetical protein [Alteraurantiacibacter aquimixticola]|nr:hypothetical protein [Alteraurantiacibacter aquimixticola]
MFPPALKERLSDPVFQQRHLLAVAIGLEMEPFCSLFKPSVEAGPKFN